MESAGTKPSVVRPQAIAVMKEVGIDIELKRFIPDALDIAQRFFAAPEIAAMERVPFNDRSSAFLRYWTKKEACLKVSGRGLSGDVASVDVGMDREPRVITIHHRDGNIPQSVYLQTLNLPGYYVGSLATSYPTGVLNGKQVSELPAHVVDR